MQSNAQTPKATCSKCDLLFGHFEVPPVPKMLFLCEMLLTLLRKKLERIICFCYGSVIRLGDFLLFGRLFKASGSNLLAQLPTFWAFFDKVSKYFIFLVKFLWATFLSTLGDFLLNPAGHPVITVRLITSSQSAKDCCRVFRTIKSFSNLGHFVNYFTQTYLS